jgi:predicted short-subunit dehydrogenase-like oxidoreductase (DUF2520 family)
VTLAGTAAVVIGPGSAGTVLGAALAAAGATVGAVGGGGPSRRRFTERVSGARTSGDAAALVPDAGLIVIATPDDVVEHVVRDLAAGDLVHEGQRVVHVAGSRGLEVLRLAALNGARIAACHPAQTFPARVVGPEVLDGVAWAVTAAAVDRRWAHDLVRALGGVPHDLAERDRVLYHAGLAVGSNAVGAVVSVARQLLLGAGIEQPSSFLEPLIRASIHNVLEGGADAITGPVRRGDLGTVEAHLRAIDEDIPGLAPAYRWLGRVVLGQVRPELSGASAAELEAALADPEAR